jgi:cholesterol transport system auxiliary component
MTFIRFIDYALIAFIALVLSACQLAGPVRAPQARYDFGDVAAQGGSSWPESVSVSAAPWLAGPEMHYRLHYADPQRRYSYRDARWLAPPADLLTQAIQQRSAIAPEKSPRSTCRLHLVIDELEQRFTRVDSSEIHLNLRAQWLAPRGAVVLNATAIRVREPVAVSDTQSAANGATLGAAASARAVSAALAQLDGWVAQQMSVKGCS